MFLSYEPEPRCQEEIPVLVTFAPLEKPARMQALIDYFAVRIESSAAVPVAVEWAFSPARQERQDCSRFSATEPE